MGGGRGEGVRVVEEEELGAGAGVEEGDVGAVEFVDLAVVPFG